MDHESIPQKRCSACGQLFPATTEFFREHVKGNGKLIAKRRPCHRKYSADRKREKYHENLENSRRKNKKDAQLFRDRHRQLVRENDRKRRLERFLKDPDAERQRDRKRNQRWRNKNPEKHRARIHRARFKRRARIEAQECKSFTATDIATHLKNQKGKCWWCGKKLKGNYHIDHRIPIARGGTNDASNVCLSCPKCNLTKNSKMPWEWSSRLL